MHVKWISLIIFGFNFYQPQSDVVVFEIIHFHIFKNLVIECSHGISINDIVSFDSTLVILSTAIV